MSENSEIMYLDEFFDQTEVWINKDGYQQISEMTVVHRRKSAGYMLRKAPQFAVAVLCLDDSVVATDAVARIANPQDWMRRTKLYKSMIANGADPDAYWTD